MKKLLLSLLAVCSLFVYADGYDPWSIQPLWQGGGSQSQGYDAVDRGMKQMIQMQQGMAAMNQNWQNARTYQNSINAQNAYYAAQAQKARDELWYQSINYYIPEFYYMVRDDRNFLEFLKKKKVDTKNMGSITYFEAITFIGGNKDVTGIPFIRRAINEYKAAYKNAYRK